MKKGIIYPVGRITVQNDRECVSIEEEMRKALASGEPIKGTAKITYNDRKDGVLPQHDIRQDRFELAMMATDRVHASQFAQRMGADNFVQNENGQWVQKTDGTPIGEAN